MAFSIKFEKKPNSSLFIILNMPVFNFRVETPHDFVTDFGTGIKLLGIEVTDERWLPCALFHDLTRGLRCAGIIIINGKAQRCPAYLSIAISFSLMPKRWQRWPALVGIVIWELIRPLYLLKKRLVNRS